jgi:broad specificity phosphatase PhoE
MKEMILVRHGESQYNVKLTKELDSELTPNGINQAKVTGQYLKDNFDHISTFVGITSPYFRCLQTSRIIKDITGISFIVHPGPREIMTTYSSALVKNHREQFPEFTWEHEHDLIFDNETEEEFISRIKTFHEGLEHQKMLIVSHGTSVNTLYEFSVGLRGTADTVNFVKNCSISYVRDRLGIYFGKIVY